MRFILYLVLLLSSEFAIAEIDSRLQTQLINMAEQSQQVLQSLAKQEDQSGHQTLKTLATKISDVQTQTLRQIISLHGWPTKHLVGKEGVNAAFQLVQHSSDLAFQQDMLPLIIQSYMNQDGIAGSDVAELTDQVSLKQGKKQVFGTQAKWVDGQVVIAPIENEQSVDQLRKEMGLPPLIEFKQQLNTLYQSEVQSLP